MIVTAFIGLLQMIFVIPGQGDNREKNRYTFSIKPIAPSIGVSFQRNTRIFSYGTEIERYGINSSQKLNFPGIEYNENINPPGGLSRNYSYYSNGVRFPFASINTSSGNDVNAGIFFKYFPFEKSPGYLNVKFRRNLYGNTQKIQEVLSSDMNFFFPNVGSGAVQQSPNMTTEINIKPTNQALLGFGYQYFGKSGFSLDLNVSGRVTRMEKNIIVYNDLRHFVNPSGDVSLRDLIANKEQFKNLFRSTKELYFGFSIGFSFPVDVPEQKTEVRPESEKTEEKSEKE
ncbi:MAG TPA: hypothetical protein PK453_19595 [Leptospiraceae bacterium]|nr:hypothetical protein [Leptospiraceae bacterium]HNF15876.1 hypothetical protein [Leptospiraceae bacterium]HNF28233.1 hypothetical protein [Leptospiraceae bacterium]